MIAVVLAVALAVSPPAPPMLMTAAPDLGLILAIGRIDEGFAARLEHMLDQEPRLGALEIDSTGGYVAAAHRAIQLVNRRGVTVRVRGRCASACALLWAGANRRELGPTARVGLHAWRPSKEMAAPMEGFGRWWTRRRAEEILRGAGFPEQLIGKGLDTPANQILWISAPELREVGVQFGPISRPSARKPSQSPNNSSKPTSLRGAA